MNGPMRYMIPHRGREVRGTIIRPDGGCPLVLFSHGFGGSGADFSKMAADLAERGIGSLCIDFCGGNKRAQQYLSTEQMTLETEQEDLHAAIDRLLADGVPREKLFLFDQRPTIAFPLVRSETNMSFFSFDMNDDWSILETPREIVMCEQ